jgi:hypothetical protein
MAEFLHDVVRKRELSIEASAVWQSVRHTVPIPADPWAEVEVSNADEELHYSGGPF